MLRAVAVLFHVSSLVLVAACPEQKNLPAETSKLKEPLAFVISGNRDVTLPIAEHWDAAKPAPVVSITHPADDQTGGVVTLDGVEIETVQTLLAKPGGWKIPTLVARLKNRSNRNTGYTPGVFIVQADRRIHFKLIKQVIYCFGLAGYTTAHFAVRAQRTNKTGVIATGYRMKTKLAPDRARIVVLLDEFDGYSITGGSERFNVPKLGQTYDTEKLAKVLQKMRAQVVDKRSLIIAVQDDVRHMDLTRSMDVARSLRFTIEVRDASPFPQ